MYRFLLALPLLATLALPAEADIRIAVIGPMTGPYQALGKQIQAGVQKAADDINAKGGIGGERISVDVEDDACKADDAAAAANRAAGRGDVLVVGHVCAEAAKAAAAVYAKAGIVAITPAVTAIGYTDERAGPSIFRLATRDDAQGAAAGAYLASHFADARIAILHDGSPYGKPLADATKQAMNEAGKREARADSFDPGAKDYNALADRLKADAIDVVFVGGYQADAALILKALRAKGSKAILMGGDALGTSEFVNSAGDAAEGTLLTFFTDWRLAPDAQNVVAAMRAAGTEPQGYTLPAYAAVQSWAAARQSAGATGTIAALSTDITPTILGALAFDAKGDAEIPGFTVNVWKDGVFAPAQ
ncbi:branched-chain amino acid ABC transporter substrate-binding protein [Kaistia dalseonensis]|uniref:Branched-chain amino acid transport system substrate-binding protein n=1 Tax=Kaistia dalseonensis TaxID=410840 RepID=A0ABU0HBD4_9HYPH|nr:branched-chain amino acid ABC transporter substrate-binding protein [Kaistia dalseonensis]MCX5496998.1 branched-chain amino acid ABC transporter substrate-binding protein [Kaistia dalseonensis]MDQ0439624.1 branched-chain amino acid transport system substrate-binding protein [Kaistia dalseonensis]